MIPSGRQIREARSLLGWSQAEFSRKVGISPVVLDAVEERGSTFMLLHDQLLAIVRVCEEAGIDFTFDDNTTLSRDPG